MQVREVVEHIDIVPTVMDHLAIDAAVPVDGLSLIPAIRGEALQDPAICMTNNNWGMQRAWRSGRWKLIENLGPGHLGSPTGWLELYDLQLDPDEKANLVASHRELAESLRDRLHAWVERVLDGRPDPQLTYERGRPAY